MNKITQAALSALVLGACSTAVFADGEADRPGYGDQDYGKCTQVGCTKDIPITLEVPKKCEVKGGNAITLNANGGTAMSAYQIQSNTHYVLELTTANAGPSNTTFVKNGLDKFTTNIKTNGGGLVNAGMGSTNHAGMGTDNYTVSVTNAAATAANKAGTYTDTYKIKVSY